MGNFEWRTEEDGAEDGLRPEPQPGPGPSRQLVLLVLLVVIVAAGGVYLVYARTHDRVAETIERVRQDVRGSHEVVRQAGMQADLELFQRFVSSADPDWTLAQEQFVSAGRWLDHSTLDLDWQRTVSSTAAITLSADLLEAEVVSHEAYQYTKSSGEQATALLAHTRVYRLGPDRWLFAPPRSEFWGEETGYMRPRLWLTYPSRDAALAQRLARDLSDLVERACKELADLRCPENYRLSVHLTRNPALLLNTQPGTLPLWAEQPLALPAPSLAGVPLDEASYEALYLGYARHVVAAAIADLVEWPCCQPGLYFQVLLEEQWQQLRLAAAPPAPQARVYSQMLQAQVDVANGPVSWASVPVVDETPALQEVRVIVDFLQQRFPESSAGHWQRELSEAESYADWVAAVTGEAAGPSLAMGWYSYLYEHSDDDNGESTVEAPDQDLLLMCDIAGGGRVVTRFDTADERFSRLPEIASLGAEIAPATFAPASPLGVFIPDYRSPRTGDEAWGLRILRWQDGQQQLVWDSGDQESDRYRFVGASPDGRFIVVREELDSQLGLAYYNVGEVAACLQSGCHWHRLSSPPAWSPDGRYVVDATPLGHVMYPAAAFSGSEEPLWYLPQGGSAFWLDEETFAYAAHFGGELVSLLVGSVSERQVQTLVDVGDLRPYLPVGGIIAPNIGLVRHPADRNVVFLAVQTVRSEPPTDTFVFLVRRDTGQSFNLFRATNGAPTSLSISPAGRWLALKTEEGLLLYDLVEDRGGVYTEGEQQIEALWSASGDWLFTGGEGLYYLIAPGEDTRRISTHAFSCDAAVWLGN